jgi:hypothetical protein
MSDSQGQLREFEFDATLLDDDKVMRLHEDSVVHLCDLSHSPAASEADSEILEDSQLHDESCDVSEAERPDVTINATGDGDTTNVAIEEKDKSTAADESLSFSDGSGEAHEERLGTTAWLWNALSSEKCADSTPHTHRFLGEHRSNTAACRCDLLRASIPDCKLCSSPL